MNRRVVWAATIIALTGLSRLAAQWAEPRAQFGFLLGGGYPVGEFHQYVTSGMALQTYVTIGRGALAARLDVLGVLYGHESVRRPLSPTVPQIMVDVATNNYFWSVEAGPELRLEHGRLGMYGYGTGGFSYFATRSTVEGTDFNNQPFASTTNFDDFTWALTGGGGWYVLVARGRTPVAIALDARHVWHGTTRYLRDGSIALPPGGPATFTPIESRTNIVVVTLGVRIGARPRP